MKGKIIVFEGLDASGKATQAKLLCAKMRKARKKAEVISFPQYERFFGALVGKYLRGDFGKKESLAQEFAALLYSLDRYEAKRRIEKKLPQGINLIMDRYTEANLYHAARFSSKKQQLDYIKWIKKVESRMPPANVTFFLDMPEKAAKLLLKKEGKEKDIHELDRAFQKRVRKVFEEEARKNKKWVKVNCIRKKGAGFEIKSKKEIADEVWGKIKEKI